MDLLLRRNVKQTESVAAPSDAPIVPSESKSVADLLLARFNAKPVDESKLEETRKHVISKSDKGLMKDLLDRFL